MWFSAYVWFSYIFRLCGNAVKCYKRKRKHVVVELLLHETFISLVWFSPGKMIELLSVSESAFPSSWSFFEFSVPSHFMYPLFIHTHTHNHKRYFWGHRSGFEILDRRLVQRWRHTRTLHYSCVSHQTVPQTYPVLLKNSENNSPGRSLGEGFRFLPLISTLPLLKGGNQWRSRQMTIH